MVPKSLPLFGPPRAWRQSDFTSSDDRVRGGSSQSYLTPSATLTTARFHGVLDTTTLGGAGFASQRTVTTSVVWDLSAYDGLEINVARGDGKRYTLNLKTVIPEKMQDGRDASTVEYAYSFVAPTSSVKMFATWDEFKPFYRGKPRDNAEPLDTSRILRWSIMMRSFFETQSGPFSLTLRSIRARTLSEKNKDEPEIDESDWDDCRVDEKDMTTSKSNLIQANSGNLRFCAIL